MAKDLQKLLTAEPELLTVSDLEWLGHELNTAIATQDNETAIKIGELLSEAAIYYLRELINDRL
jgi:hypothetical protein